MTDDIVIPATNYSKGLVTIDQIFEHVEAAKITTHFLKCTRENCPECQKWRQQHEKCLESANQLLRRLMDLLTDRPIDPATVAAAPGRAPKKRRRYDPQKLKEDGARLETLWQIGDSWKRLGDLNAQECETLAHRYELVEQASRMMKEAFTELKVVLLRKKVARVRDVFTEKAVARLLDGVVLEETRQGWKRLARPIIQ